MATATHYKDSPLITQFRDGSEDAFLQVYSQFQERVFFFAKRFVTSIQDAEDFTADTFLQLWRRRDQQQSLDAIAAFLHITVRNKCIDYLRRKLRLATRLQQLQSEQIESEPFYIESIQIELLEKIYAEVELLPRRLKEIFLLSYRDGLKPSEIAEQLHLSVQTVKNQRLTAIRVLKTVLAQHSAAVALLMMMEISIPDFY